MVYPLKVFYDGACRICRSQMERFKRRDSRGRLVFIDISAPDFRAEKFYLDPRLVQKYLYIQTSDDQIARGIDSFIWLWRATDSPLLALFAGLPLIKQLARLLYFIVARGRYLFGKKETICPHCAKGM